MKMLSIDTTCFILPVLNWVDSFNKGSIRTPESSGIPYWDNITKSGFKIFTFTLGKQEIYLIHLWIRYVRKSIFRLQVSSFKFNLFCFVSVLWILFFFSPFFALLRNTRAVFLRNHPVYTSCRNTYNSVKDISSNKISIFIPTYVS